MGFSGCLSLSENLKHKENQGMHNKQRNQNAKRPRHIAEEAGHFHFALLGDGFHHKVRRVADVAECAHKHRAHGNRQQRVEQLAAHQLVWVAACHVKEYEVGGGVVQEA